MTKKDKIFVFIAGILIILFIASVLENISSFSFWGWGGPKGVSDLEKDTAQILSSLEQAGLKPREAKYYNVIE